jgi:serine/threonine-protein kinase TTK/MPS1
MEMGEIDLNRLLNARLTVNPVSIDPSANVEPTLDLAFTRFYWREMLCCLRAVHAHDIVHSDLKPANFLLVQGQLKLIDFGIANRIETDATMNVYRESHVGTPNYMSPESIIDTNANVPVARGHPAANTAGGKLMRIGKPSDIWSLGCILYQMTYGRPPFAHIANQIHRIMAITNPAVAIEFSDTGIGGSWVPHSLRGCLRKCLNRDPAKRPTVAELLSERDAFLHPDGYHGGDAKTGIEALPITQELLGQIISRVVDRCSKGVPEEEEVRAYPASFFAKIAELMEKA